MNTKDDIYLTRKLADGYPDLDKMAHELFTESLEQKTDHSDMEGRLTYFNRLVGVGKDTAILEIGCGPRPTTLKKLVDSGYNVVGVEPVRSFVESAREFIGDDKRVIQGEAERLALPDESFDIVVFEVVLEHVDSPIKSLEEIWRVLKPGGMLYLSTTNRHRFRITGHDNEFNVRFYNWFPRIVKECYVFDHLHYRPTLANGTTRPAVHWFTYSDLCAVGRNAGFAQFYSFLDLLRPEDPAVKKSFLRKTLLRYLQRKPWLRAIALTQFGSTIIMLKRKTLLTDES